MKHFLEREFVVFRIPETFFSKIISIFVLKIKSHVLQRHSFPVKIDPFEAKPLASLITERPEPFTKKFLPINHQTY
jgi:hypothetical protein